MATDSQGRPLSDDGQWAWNGTDWVPATSGGQTPAASSESDAGTTTIAPSPFATEGPAAAGPPAFGGTPDYDVAPQQPRSKLPIIIGVIGVLVIAAVVVVLVLTLGGSD